MNGVHRVFLSCQDCSQPEATPIETTLYTLLVTDSLSCTIEEEILVTVLKKRNIFIPNIFSPNFDGLNDVFMIYGGKDVIEILKFNVFDRWGATLFEARNFQPNQETYGWNGIYKNKEMNPGVFVYYVEVLFVDGETRFYKGSVTLVK